MEQTKSMEQSNCHYKRKEEERDQTRNLVKEEKREKTEKKEFSFSLNSQSELDKELDKPRSRAYLEILDAIDFVSATDEEIIAEIKSKMTEEMADDFSDMSVEEMLEEIKASIQEEFQKIEIELKPIMYGILDKCYISGCDIHEISGMGTIMAHFEANKPMPDNLAKGRVVFHKHPGCRAVEVYNNCCRVVNRDGSVIRIPDSEI